MQGLLGSWTTGLLAWVSGLLDSSTPFLGPGVLESWSRPGVELILSRNELSRNERSRSELGVSYVLVFQML